MPRKEILSPGKIVFQKLLRNRLAMAGAVILIILTVISLLAPVLARWDQNKIDLFSIEAPPSAEHPLGTDELGRDVLSRLLYGGRVSIMVGICATLVQVTIGILLGMSAGFFGRIADSIIMRICDIVMCFPFYAIAISLAALLGANVWNVVFIVGALNWTGVARIVRAETLSLRSREFIDAARALSLNNVEIIWRHILPNVLGPIIIYATLGIATGVLSEASLSFLGLGVKPPQPSWGNMLSAAQNMRILSSEWWMWIPPGIMVFLLVLSINFVGDGLRDALDPTATLV
ncbi:MAG: ABC transporter permease [Treponema sp.]|jgi:peptide/nickel transport system permease protein|nr:ABC transporter permease [Treponema sp.]